MAYNNNNALGRHHGKTSKCVYINNNLVNSIITMTLIKDIFRVAVFNNQIQIRVIALKKYVKIWLLTAAAVGKLFRWVFFFSNFSIE